MAESTRELLYRVAWAGRDVTEDISAYVASITYVDYLSGKSDNVELVLSDADGRWRSDWFPQKGDELTLEIGTSRIGYVNAGRFYLDEVEIAGPPDTITVRGLGFDMTVVTNFIKSRAWEDVTIADVVSTIAAEYSLGTRYVRLPPELETLRFDRLDQSDVSDLAFLRDLANRYDCLTRIDRGELIFADRETVAEEIDAITLVIGVDGIESYRLQSRWARVYRAAEIKYWNPYQAGLVSVTVEDPNIASGAVLRLNDHAGSQAHAEAIAVRRLRAANRREWTGEFRMFGWHGWISGAKVRLSGFGVYDGDWLVEESTHRIDRSAGYSVSIKVSLWTR